MINPINLLDSVKASTDTAYLFNLLKKTAQLSQRSKAGNIDITVRGLTDIKEQLPEMFSELAAGLSRPSVKIRSKFTGSSNIAGFSIQSGNKPVENAVMSLSEDGQVLQLRRQAFDKNEKIFTEAFLGDSRYKAEECTDTFRRKGHGVMSVGTETGKALRYSAEMKIGAADRVHPTIKLPESLDDNYCRLQDIKEVESILTQINPEKLMPEFNASKQKFEDLKEKFDILNAELKATHSPDEYQKILSDPLSEINKLRLEKNKATIEFLELRSKVDQTRKKIDQTKIEKLKRKVNTAEHRVATAEQSLLQRAVQQRVSRFKLPKVTSKEASIQSQLKALEQQKLDPLRQAKQAKNIIARNLGIDPQLIKIKKLDNRTPSMQAIGGGFIPKTGEIYISENVLKSNPTAINAIIRHEMVHAEDFIKLYKSIGVTRFVRLLERIEKGSSKKFNKNLYDQLSININTKGFDVSKYLEGAMNYIQPKKNIVAYYNNPFEQRAYSIEALYDKSCINEYYKIKYMQDINLYAEDTKSAMEHFRKTALEMRSKNLLNSGRKSIDDDLIAMEKCLSDLEKAHNNV